MVRKINGEKEGNKGGTAGKCSGNKREERLHMLLVTVEACGDISFTDEKEEGSL